MGVLWGCKGVFVEGLCEGVYGGAWECHEGAVEVVWGCMGISWKLFAFVLKPAGFASPRFSLSPFMVVE